MENRYYGTGDIIESATGYLVKVGEPVVDCKVTADENGDAALPNDKGFISNDTQYLVTLEVNGESKMYRELWMSGNGNTANTVALSDYTYTMDEGSIGGLTEDDVVVARFEPVEVYTSDAFRAAVGKVAPKAEGGGSGGGVLVVHSIDDYTTLDKTWQEIHDAALNCVVVLIDEVDQQISPLYLYEVIISGSEYQVAFGDAYYIATSASGYPVYSDLNNGE